MTTALASERARAYASFAAALAYPRDDVLAGPGIDADGLQEEFTQLFEAGEGGPPCPLLESHYRGAELANLEELARYYDFYGLSLPEDRQVRPDHLVTQLEFLHFLAFHEAQPETDPDAAAGLARTQRDFIERHTGAWVPLLREAVSARAASPFFPELLGLLDSFIAAESLRLRAQVGLA